MSKYETVTVTPHIVGMTDLGDGTVRISGVVLVDGREQIGTFDTEVEGTLNPGEVDG